MTREYGGRCATGLAKQRSANSRLPKCAELLNQHTSAQAMGTANQGRNEVETVLRYLRHELDRPSK
jgi:hypothetical protein